MKRYFPYLRGKQNELMALRELAEEIAESGKVLPIIEPVNRNGTTRISLDRYIEVSMPFLLICNPLCGEFEGNPDALFGGVMAEVSLMEYDNWTPTLCIRRESSAAEISAFQERYQEYEVAVIYNGLPTSPQARALLDDEDIIHHVFIVGRVGADYVNTIPAEKRVLIADRFQRQPRNADYPEQELFTDMNTTTGNPDRLDFGDYSIVGDYFTETGGPAYAVALHHIHFQDDGSGPLDISHYISDSNATTADTPGKIIEAINKLVEALDDVQPNNTEACDEYREMAETETSRGLGYMKRLAIKHHLEVMLNGGIQL
jgi:hypothetical protein